MALRSLQRKSGPFIIRIAVPVRLPRVRPTSRGRRFANEHDRKEYSAERMPCGTRHRDFETGIWLMQILKPAGSPASDPWGSICITTAGRTRPWNGDTARGFIPAPANLEMKFSFPALRARFAKTLTCTGALGSKQQRNNNNQQPRPKVPNSFQDLTSNVQLRTSNIE